MRVKVDMAQPVTDSRGKPIVMDQTAAAHDLVRFRVALGQIERGDDDPEAIAAKALAQVEDEPMQLRDLIEQTLNNRKVKVVDGQPVPDEPELTEPEKRIAGRLAIRIHARDVLELSTKEVRFLERRSGAVGSPLGHMRLLMALHPERDYLGDDDDLEDGEGEDT